MSEESRLKKLVLTLLLIASIGACSPTKVTDPSDPNFNPDKFSFRDYGEGKEMSLHEAFRRLFPLGVEHVLVEVGGVEQYGCSDWNNLCAYRFPRYMQGWKGGAKLQVLFDENDRLIAGAGHPNFGETLRNVDEKLREDQKNER